MGVNSEGSERRIMAGIIKLYRLVLFIGEREKKLAKREKVPLKKGFFIYPYINPINSRNALEHLNDNVHCFYHWKIPKSVCHQKEFMTKHSKIRIFQSQIKHFVSFICFILAPIITGGILPL